MCSQCPRAVARAEVECEGCGASWQGVWVLIGMAKITDRDAKHVKGKGAASLTVWPLRGNTW